jgi:8-oxo-dGTP pyrophosphatase MutT (NUDIX family)
MAIRIPFIQKQQGPAAQALPPMSGQAPIPANNAGDNPSLPRASTDNPIEQILGHTTQEPAVGDVRPRAGIPPFGGSGRANFYGLPQPDELNQKLIGPNGLRILDDMYWSDAHVRRLILAAWSPVVAGTWSLEPYGGNDATDQDKQIANTIWRGLHEFMSPNFKGHLSEVGPALLRFGFVPFEQQWDEWKDAGKTLLFPRKLGFMLPRTIWKWWQDDFGDLTWIGQILPNKSDVVVPRSELCYYRLAAEGDNWMGRSLLRHAYKHFVFKDRLERIQAIGCERSAKGVPVVYRSPDVNQQVLNQLEQALTMLHVSEVGYLVMPGWKMGAAPADADPTNQFLVDTVQYNSSSDNSIKDAIDYHQRAMSASFLTDFLELGHHQVGARATAQVQEDPFLTALHGAMMPPILPELNRLVERIRVVNWPDAAGTPRLKVTLHDDASLTEIAAYVQQLQMAGAMQVDPPLEDWLRERAAMPTADPDVRSQRRERTDAENEAAIAAANAKTQDPMGLKAAAAKAPSVASPGSQGQAGRAAMPPGGVGKSMAMQGNTTKLDQADGPAASGLVVHAADTGRVLMIQRQKDKADDKAANQRWEFPGGKLDDGEDSFGGGRREWQEETGAKLPKNARRIGSFVTPDGVYEAHGFRVPHESGLQLGTHDHSEVKDVAWRGLDELDGPDMRDKVQAMSGQVRGMLSLKGLDAAPGKVGRTIAIDFDGVIADAETGKPVQDPITGLGAIDILPKLAKEFEVIVFTAHKDLQEVRDWLKKHGLGQFADTVTNIKPRATAYVDDNGIEFKVWAKVAEQVVDQVRRGTNPPQPKHLDQPSLPPNLRLADGDDLAAGEQCGTCRMFWKGECWGYGNRPVKKKWVCDSWEPSPADGVEPSAPPPDPTAGPDDDGDMPSPSPGDQVGQILNREAMPPAWEGALLDDAGMTPMSGGTGMESGLQMVPKMAGAKKCPACGGRMRRGVCVKCGKRPSG